MIGNAVGLGNVWRFPYMAYNNGGAAFLIPYFICMFVVGISGILIETTMGQYSAMGTAHAFYKCVKANSSTYAKRTFLCGSNKTPFSSCVPLFKGVGLAHLFNAVFIIYYYNVIIAWTVYFFGASFASTLPWSGCDNSGAERSFYSFDQ